MKPALRKWLYAVSTAAVPLLVWHGDLDPKAAPLVIGFLVAFWNVNPDE